MNTRRVVIPVIVLMVAVMALPAFGFEQYDVEIHGFVSQGYFKSSDNHYMGNSEDGSYEFNEIGVNFSAPITDGLRFGIQLFSRDLGDIGNNELIVDWGFLDYSWQDWLGFRAGKIKMPFGLYSRQRDVDMLRTSIILPQSVYNEGFRDFIIAFYGASIYGSPALGTFGYIDYEVFVGTINVPSNTQYINEMTGQMAYIFPEMATVVANMDFSDINMHQGFGGLLVWHTPLKGLRIGGTDIIGDGDIDISLPSGDPAQPEIIIPSDMTITEFSVLSVEYDIKNLLLAAERFKMGIDYEAAGFPEIPTEMEGWYASVSWQALNWMALGLCYGEYYPHPDDKKGSYLEAGDAPDYYAWQKDITGSLRFNINEYFCMKFEVHKIDGLALAGIISNPIGNEKDEWYLYAVKTSLNF